MTHDGALLKFLRQCDDGATTSWEYEYQVVSSGRSYAITVWNDLIFGELSESYHSQALCPRGTEVGARVIEARMATDRDTALQQAIDAVLAHEQQRAGR